MAMAIVEQKKRGGLVIADEKEKELEAVMEREAVGRVENARKIRGEIRDGEEGCEVSGEKFEAAEEVSGHEGWRKEAGGLNSSVILRIKRNPGLSVTVQYAEDGEDVEFERHESSDRTESSDSEEEDEDENENNEEYDINHEVVAVDPSSVEDAAGSQLDVMTEARLKFLLEKTRVRRRGGVGDGGGNDLESECLYTVDGDYDPLFLPQLESARVQANRSILMNRMAQAAFAMKLPPSGLYLAVLLLDFYWGHDRDMGRRMDSVQLQVLSYTCLYVASNRFATPGRTPDEFCRWAGVAERSVKGCMIIRQLEAFGTLLQGPEKVSSITSQSLWAHMKHLDPEEHMSKFIRHLETSEYGRAYFTAAVLKDARDVEQQAASISTLIEDAGKVMKDRLLFVATMNARNKRSSQDATMDKTENAASNPPKLICLQQKIAVL